MAKLSTFVRYTSNSILHSYFDHTAIQIPESVDWRQSGTKLVKPLLAAIDKMDIADQARVTADAERVVEMAGEEGQIALKGVVSDKERFEQIASGHDRALWVFLNHRQEFERAEESRYADRYRRGSIWSGFVGMPGMDLRDDDVSIGAFKGALRARLRSENVEVERFERIRLSYDGEHHRLIQITIYSEELPRDDLAFDKVRGLVRQSRRPVREATVTYEPASGVIEIVGKDKESRLDIARFLARDLMGMDFKENRLPFKRYDLSCLTRPCAFPVDAQDGIESVELKLLRLMPIDEVGERLTLECMTKAQHTIWDMAGRFGHTDPLQGGFVCTKAELSIGFHPKPGSKKGRTMQLKITMPHGCNLKDQTPDEEMIAEKYLRRWKLLEDA